MKKITLIFRYLITILIESRIKKGITLIRNTNEYSLNKIKLNNDYKSVTVSKILEIKKCRENK